MSEAGNDRNCRTGVRCYAMILAAVTMLLLASITASAEPLTATERAWLKDKGQINFVSQAIYPPFEFVNERGNPQGMCIELVQWMAAELGFKTSFRNMTFREAQAAVLTGEADVLTSLFYSKARDRRFDFSDTTWEVPALIFVRAERPDITSVEDLQGERIAMQRGDHAAEFLKSKGIVYDLVPTATFAEATDRMIAGEADAVIGDRQIVLYHLFSNDLTDRVKSVGEPLYIGRNCMAVREGQHKLASILNKGLMLARERGVFENITRKWVGVQYTQEVSWMYRHVWHLAIALAVVAAFATLVVIWSIHLKKIVARRTRELLESHDALRPIAARNKAVRPTLKMWLWVLAAFIPLCIGGYYALRHYVILPGFLSLEKLEAEKTVSGCVDAVNREAHHVGLVVGDWAMWDDTYHYAQDGNAAYANSNFKWESLTNSGIHLVYICDLEGKVVWGGILDPVKNVEITLDKFPRDSFPKSHPLLQHKSLDSEITGIILTERGPMLITSRPIVTSKGKGPSRGVIVMGRFLLKKTIRELSKQIRVRFSVLDPHTSELDEYEREVFTRLSPGKQITKAVDDDVLMGYGVLTDLEGNPALLVSAELPRKIMQRGRATVRIVAITLMATAIFIGVCLFAWFFSSLTESFQRQAHIEALVKERTSALRSSEEMLQLVINNIPQAVFWKDRDSVFLGCNKALADIVGIADAKEIVGKTDYDLSVTKEEADSYREYDRQIMDADMPKLHIEECLRKPDGSKVWLTTNKVPLHDDEGNVMGILVTFEDITERKRLEEQVRQRLIALTQPELDLGGFSLPDIVDLDVLQQLQDGFAEAFNMPSIIYDPDGAPITKPSCFTKFCELVRSTPKGAANCEAFDSKLMCDLRVNHTPQIRRECALSNMVTGTVPIVVQGRHLANWGIGQMVNGEPDFDEIRRYAREIDLDEEELAAAAKMLRPVNDEALEHAIGFLDTLARQVSLLALQNLQQGREIAERKQAEGERDRLATAIEQTSDVILITDTNGNIKYANPAFEEVTGYTRKQAVGRNPRILKSGKHDETFYRQLWETISGGKTWEGRFINKKKDGELYTEEATISPVRNEAGEIVNYVAVKHDITENLRIHNEKSKLEAQFQQSQKVEAIGRLAGGVAHDLNNLLTPILGYGQILAADVGLDDSRKKKVERIVQAGTRARDLVRQLLAFSRKQTLEYKDVDLNNTVLGFEKLLRRTIREDIAIEILLFPGVRSVKADIGQIEQVIMNLAVNAQDAMPDGGKLIIETSMVRLDENYASVRPGVEPGEYVMLAISDTGCGMDDATHKHIFEPFFSTKGEQGTGLGLATVYGIVKQHGGNIWVYSEPGQGATFKIYLPVSEKTAAEIETTSELPADLAGTETILVVEDNIIVRDIVFDILKKYNYTVLVAENGSEALAILETHDRPVHLLLTDVVMPGMNGKELYIQAVAKQAGLKVLYMSGYTDNVIAHRGVLEEGVAFIQKPFNVLSLASKVREVLWRPEHLTL